MLIVTNFTSFPKEWTASGGLRGRTVYAADAAGFLAQRGSGILYLVNCDPGLTLRLAAAKLTGRSRTPLISVDLVLRRPSGWRARTAAPLKRLLFAQVDHFIHYFRDVSEYNRVFGIGPSRSSFVPFKVNLSDRHEMKPEPEGQYVLCFGRSMRDYDTFFAAMEQTPYPGAIARPDVESLRRNAARFTRPPASLPSNVHSLEDDGTEEAQIRILGGAALVTLPIVKGSMVASGISTCLNAMRLGKCVIGTEGPGMSDTFLAGEALVVPAEDPAALAAAIRRLWEDSELRRRTAAAGHAYALRAGGEADLYQRILDQVAAWRKVQG